MERIGAQDASSIKELNNSNDYCWMLNKHNRKVPIARHLVADKLSKGFIHTDGVFISDDLSLRVKSPEAPITPADAMLKVAEKLAENAEVQAQVLEEVAGVKRGRKKKEIVEETSTEVV
jgi:hypothetical protein